MPITYTLQIIDPTPVNPLQLVSTIDPSLISASAVGLGDVGLISASADGRYVVYAGPYVTNVATSGSYDASAATSAREAGQFIGGNQVYLYDALAKTTTPVPGTVTPGSDYAYPMISPDGRYLAYLAYLAGNASLYVRDLQAGVTSLVSSTATSLGQTQSGFATGTSGLWVMSGNSRFLVFAAGYNDPVTGDSVQLFEYDLQTGTTAMVSVDAAGTGGTNVAGSAFSTEGFNATVSADGRFIAFQSEATNLVANGTGGSNQLFLRDMQQGTTTLLASNTAQWGYYPQISADGSTVVFTVNRQVFACDLATKTTTLVSDTTLVSPYGSRFGQDAVVSADGRYVAFDQPAAEIINNVPYPDYRVYVCDRQSGTTALVSIHPSGPIAPGACPRLAPTGATSCSWTTAASLAPSTRTAGNSTCGTCNRGPRRWFRSMTPV